MYKDHILLGPRVVFIYKFHCACKETASAGILGYALLKTGWNFSESLHFVNLTFLCIR